MTPAPHVVHVTNIRYVRKSGGSDRHGDDHHNHGDDDNVQSVWKVVSGVRGRGCTTAAT